MRQHDHDAAPDHRLRHPGAILAPRKVPGYRADDQRDQHRPVDAVQRSMLADRGRQHQRDRLDQVGADQLSRRTASGRAAAARP